MRPDKIERPVIGLLVANIEDDFSNGVTKGAMAAAEALDVDLIIYPGKYLGIEDRYIQVGAEYEYQHNVLFDHAAAMRPDFIIAAIGTIGYALTKEKKQEFMARLGDIPCLSLADKTEGYDYLVYDNRSGVRDAIDYLAAQGRKKICMMVGDLNNTDCLERYEEYREGLRRNGLEFRDRYAVASDISSLCRTECEMLVRNNPEMDAVFCVNDSIAEVMCRVLKEHKLHIGADVSVVGFDDLPSSAEMDPPLASVRADAVILGKRAMEKAVNLLRGIKDEECFAPTQFIPRRSAFSPQTKGGTVSGMFQGSIREIVANIAEFSRWKNESNGDDARLKLLSAKLREIFLALEEDIIRTVPCTEEGMLRIRDAAEDFFMSRCLTIEDVANSYDVVNGAYDYLKKQCPPENLPQLEAIYRGFYRRFTMEAVINYRSLDADNAQTNHINNIFIRDTVMFGSSIKESYAAILKRMTEIGADTAYLYIFKESVVNKMWEHFKSYEGSRLVSYCYGKNTFTVPRDESLIPPEELARCSIFPQERRYTLLAAALFSNERQYGIAFIEPRTPEFFSTLELADYQLSSAVRMIELMKDQEHIRAELHSRNMALEQMSKIDELTGIFNRRGFYVAAEELICESHGQPMTVCYADMDNLKLVNDNYGHGEGDASIAALAECMRTALGEDAVIGRMGGDEYAGIVLGSCAEEARRRKEEFLERYNASGEKPYLLGMSMGLYTCSCDNSYDLREALDKADGLLYEAKSRRKKNISKR